MDIYILFAKEKKWFLYYFKIEIKTLYLLGKYTERMILQKKYNLSFYLNTFYSYNILLLLFV